MQTKTYDNFNGRDIIITTFYEGDEDPPADTIVTKIYQSPTFTYTFYRKYHRDRDEITKDMKLAEEHTALHHAQLSQLGEYLGRRIFFPAPAAEEARACWERETGELRLKLVKEWLPHLSALKDAVNPMRNSYWGFLLETRFP